ncbi:MAG: recA-like protein [Erythrobacter sp.]|uniref:recA-like protein n=1 Tax=Erythrobacter sp. TaxID=1042 RepID=UPI003C737504
MTDLSSSSGAKALDGLAASSATLSGADIAALSKAREARWRPGLDDQPLHSEIFANLLDASGAGLALALARDALAASARVDDPLAEPEDRRQVLWVQDAKAVQHGGRPYVHGLPGDLRDRLIHVEAATPEDALFALEEGLRCRDLACVIGEIVGNPRALDFTASRRLSLTAEKHGVALWLVRLEARADLSSARMRWRAAPAPSPAPRWNAAAPGASSWTAELFRARSHAPGQWTLTNDDGHLAVRRANDTGAASSPDPRDLVRPTVGRSLAAIARA